MERARFTKTSESVANPSFASEAEVAPFVAAVASTMTRAKSPSVRQYRDSPSPISPLSPLYISPVHDAAGTTTPPPDLNLDCGSKKSIARRVATSPQRYSGAFSSQVPRFASSAYSGPPRFYDASEQQPHISVTDPARKSLVFRSVVARFPEDVPAFEARGMHPSMKKPQSSSGYGESKHLHFDENHWQRPGFFHPRGPRLPKPRRPITADLEAPDLLEAGEHVDGNYLSLVQNVKHSPRRLRVMSSRTDRFTTPETPSGKLGPGSYDCHASAINVYRPDKMQSSFASGSPRLPKDRLATSGVGSNTSSVEIDQRSWSQPRMWTSKAHYGRQVEGPQTGSYEGSDGLGRATSPERRSPDISYELEKSTQKRPLADEVLASKLKYSQSFRSHSPRLQISIDERRSLAYPRDATDQFDLSASASPSSFVSDDWMAGNSGYGGSTLSVTGGGGGGRRSPSFASETQRFPSQQAAEGSEICLLEADRKKWTTSGQPLTTRTARETLPELKANEWVPPPGAYINPRNWETPRKPSSPPRSRSPSSKTASPVTRRAGEHRSARRRLDISVA